jgi:hypothetical protein
LNELFDCTLPKVPKVSTSVRYDTPTVSYLADAPAS